MKARDVSPHPHDKRRSGAVLYKPIALHSSDFQIGEAPDAIKAGKGSSCSSSRHCELLLMFTLEWEGGVGKKKSHILHAVKCFIHPPPPPFRLSARWTECKAGLIIDAWFAACTRSKNETSVPLIISRADNAGRLRGERNGQLQYDTFVSSSVFCVYS